MKKILVLHGPNLNLLGQREPDQYGHTDLASLNSQLVALGDAASCQIECFQSNAEGALIDKIQSCLKEDIAAILFNPAGYTHTSITLRDALLAVNRPFIEVHVSNIYAREAFRHHSYFSDIALGVITGLGTQGYLFGLQALIKRIKT